MKAEEKVSCQPQYLVMFKSIWCQLKKTRGKFLLGLVLGQLFPYSLYHLWRCNTICWHWIPCMQERIRWVRASSDIFIDAQLVCDVLNFWEQFIFRTLEMVPVRSKKHGFSAECSASLQTTVPYWNGKERVNTPAWDKSISDSKTCLQFPPAQNEQTRLQFSCTTMAS